MNLDLDSPSASFAEARPPVVPHPRRLLEMAGAPLKPSALGRSALLLIDAQLEYLSGRLPLQGIEAAVAAAAELLQAARDAGTPVFHVVHHGRQGGKLFDPGGRYAAIIPDLSPIDGETLVVKRLPNAFAGTELHARIVSTGRYELIIAGFATHMCVSSTTRTALDLGFRSTVVAGATATRDLPHPLSALQVTPAARVQEAALAALADRFAIVVVDAAALLAAGGQS